MTMISKIVSGISNSNIVKTHLDKSVANPKYLAGFLLGASITKDVFAYTIRVHNARRNDEIPSDKKPFVIALDKATGVTTAVVQLATGCLIMSDKFQNFCCSRLFKDIKDNKPKYNVARAGFTSISTLVGAVLLAKRIVVPMIATPLADAFMDKPKSIKNFKDVQSPVVSQVRQKQASLLEQPARSYV